MQSKKSNMNLSEEKTYTDLSVNIFFPKKNCEKETDTKKGSKEKHMQLASKRR